METDLPFGEPKRGKVRDIYDLGDRLLMIVSDRISAFDCVLPEGIPDKGACLTQISRFWFDFTRDVVENHVISADVDEFGKEFATHRETLKGRSMLVKKAKPLPVECIVRGYISGSAWKEYRKEGTVCGEKMPAGLLESDRFPAPIFTPSTKAEEGHDINISIPEMKRILGDELGEKVAQISIALYKKAADYAATRGVIIADTKFEFGILDGELILIDEALTPDSSRFWPADLYEKGHSQPSFDKQYVRDFLESIEWNKEPPAPHLPDEVVAETSRKYKEAYEKMTGKKLVVF
ncbi:MAG: phosphoribosylaminoimidazolesuccinocarboxamide synthase [Thermoplasmata archaeon HGW-Thermoplasmata-1]|nr:MAG: phosphoribosylaminoimidazolesuccinocarboxamide synthase [Thermoplasmata archaeon HGW-Thermoplasmata-1]